MYGEVEKDDKSAEEDGIQSKLDKVCKLLAVEQSIWQLS